MERRNKVEYFNPYGDLISEYPILKNESPFVLGVAEEINDFFHNEINANDQYKQAKQKEMLQPKIEEQLENFVSLSMIMSRIHEDQIDQKSPLLIEKFKKIIESLEDDVETRKGNKNKIKRINKIFGIIEILDYYNKNVFAKGVVKESQNLYLENRNRNYVNLLYYKIVDGHIPEELNDKGQSKCLQFLVYGESPRKELKKILENVLGFVLKPGKGESEFGDSANSVKHGFSLVVDVEATNKLSDLSF